tara:strand:+ start:6889 stop:7380 length:492 start_codon:yes stop_codon:yes gene_type:complete
MKLIKFLVLFCFVSTSIPLHVIAIDFEKKCQELGFSKSSKSFDKCLLKLKTINKKIIEDKRAKYNEEKYEIRVKQQELENKKKQVAKSHLNGDIEEINRQRKTDMIIGIIGLGVLGGVAASGALAGVGASGAASSASGGLNAGTMSVLGIGPAGQGGPVILGY